MVHQQGKLLAQIAEKHEIEPQLEDPYLAMEQGDEMGHPEQQPVPMRWSGILIECVSFSSSTRNFIGLLVNFIQAALCVIRQNMHG